MQMLMPKSRRGARKLGSAFRYKRAGLTDMHTDLRVPEIKRVDPKDSDAVEM